VKTAQEVNPFDSRALQTLLVRELIGKYTGGECEENRLSKKHPPRPSRSAQQAAIDDVSIW